MQRFISALYPRNNILQLSSEARVGSANLAQQTFERQRHTVVVAEKQTSTFVPFAGPTRAERLAYLVCHADIRT